MGTLLAECFNSSLSYTGELIQNRWNREANRAVVELNLLIPSAESESGKLNEQGCQWAI